MIEIQLTKGLVAIVDDEDADLAGIRWHGRSNGYAARSVHSKEKRSLIYLHRQVAERALGPSALHVDHVNGNRLDNRRANLRWATRSENNRNVKRSTRNSSGYKGAQWRGDAGLWRAYIKANDRQVSLGYYATAIAAARAYDAAAIRYFGPFARLNFPEQACAEPTPSPSSAERSEA